jgi:hypothetical protein
MATPPTTDDQGEYLPRFQLSVVPVAQGPVIIAPPPGLSEPARRTGLLSLFIDEQGRVQSVWADEPKFPEAFEQAVAMPSGPRGSRQGSWTDKR